MTMALSANVCIIYEILTKSFSIGFSSSDGVKLHKTRYMNLGFQIGKISFQRIEYNPVDLFLNAMYDKLYWQKSFLADAFFFV